MYSRSRMFVSRLAVAGAAATLSAAVVPASHTSAQQAAVGPLAVLVRPNPCRTCAPSASQTYTVALVATSGRIVTQTTAVAQAGIALGTGRGGGALAIPLPPVSISRSRVYFLDGNTTVKALAPDGTVTTVTHVPGGPYTHVAFAVSPYDHRIAVSAITYTGCLRRQPATCQNARMRLYVEDLNGGGHHAELFASSSIFEWPVAWHNGGLVLAVSHLPGTQNVAPNPYNAFDGYHVVNTTTGRRLATLCESSENPGGPFMYSPGPLVPAGTLCVRTTSAIPYMVSWSGALQRLPGGVGLVAAALSPDGSRCAYTYNQMLYIRTTKGLVRTATGVRGQPDGWIDGSHLVVTVFTLDQTVTKVLDLHSGSITTIPLGFRLVTFYGTLPVSIQ